MTPHRDSFTLPDLPEVLLFRDPRDSARVHACTRTPRLARDARGVPQIGLLLYARRTPAGAPPVTGGQFSATYGVGLTPQEHAAIESRLGVRVAAPEWLSGKVCVDLTTAVRGTGAPSLAGDNVCSILITLDEDQARALSSAWAEGLPDARVRYDMVVARASSSRSEQHTGTTWQHGSRSHEVSTRVVLERSDTERQALVLEGPIARGSELEGRMQTVIF